MICVAITINGNVIVSRSAVNQAEENDKGETAYKTDFGSIVYHKKGDGAVALAHKLLDTIVEE